MGTNNDELEALFAAALDRSEGSRNPGAHAPRQNDPSLNVSKRPSQTGPRMGGSAAFGSAGTPSILDSEEDGGWASDATAISEIDPDMFSEHQLSGDVPGASALDELDDADFEQIQEGDEIRTPLPDELPLEVRLAAARARSQSVAPAAPAPAPFVPPAAPSSKITAANPVDSSRPSQASSSSGTNPALSASSLPARSESSSGVKRRASEIRGVSADTLSMTMSIPPSTARPRAASVGGILTDQPIDRRGRAQPMYEPKSPPPPGRWKPPQAIEVLMGLVPGLGLLVRKRHVSAGILYLLGAALALLPTLLVLATWKETLVSFQELSIRDTWLLPLAAVPVVSLLIFEALRALSTFDLRKHKHVLARWLGVLALPSLVLVVLGAMVVRVDPGIVEPVWFLGALCLVVGFIAGLYAFVDPKKGNKRQRLTYVMLGAVSALALTVLIMTGHVGLDALQMLAASSKAAGFKLLPSLLSAISS